MAFQAGTQIRPELANADYSGFANAANIQAQSMMNLGQQIAGGIEKYQRNKQITAAGLAELEGIVSANPNAYASVQGAGGEAAKSIKALEEGNYKQKDVLTALGAVQAYQGEEQRQNQVRLQALQEQMLQGQVDNQAINNQAFNTALDANTTPEGTVNVRGAIKTFVNQGGSNPGKLKMLETMQDLQEQDKPSKLEVLNLDGFNVLTENGEWRMATKNDGAEVTTPAAVETIKYKTEQRKKARELYEQGKVAEADDLLAALGYKDIIGKPQTAEEAFGSNQTTQDVGSTSSEKTVRMLHPNGEEYDVPQDDVEKAIGAGYKEI